MQGARRHCAGAVCVCESALAESVQACAGGRLWDEAVSGEAALDRTRAVCAERCRPSYRQQPSAGANAPRLSLVARARERFLLGVARRPCLGRVFSTPPRF